MSFHISTSRDSANFSTLFQFFSMGEVFSIPNLMSPASNYYYSLAQNWQRECFFPCFSVIYLLHTLRRSHFFCYFFSPTMFITVTLIKYSPSYMNQCSAESVLPLMVIGNGSPCPYLSPRAFFITFSSPFSGGKVRVEWCSLVAYQGGTTEIFKLETFLIEFFFILQ